MLRNLKAAIVSAGYDSNKKFAEEIGLKRQCFSNKLHELSDFTTTEAKKILQLLRLKGIEKTDFDYIFLSDSPEN